MQILNTKFMLGSFAALTMVALTGCSESSSAPSATATQPAKQEVAATTASQDQPVQLMHVHGLSYTPDGQYIYIPSHLGLAVYDHQSWNKAPGLMHDYMGFVATKDAFYTSGHPAMGSGFVNPFGLMKSTDRGQTWEKLGLEGETDFHNVAASHNTNTVYVFNPGPNSKMNSAGLYSTVDDGKTWRRAETAGLNSEPFTLAAHPDDPKKVAIGAKGGLYLSDDAGNTFRKALSTKPVTAVQYDLDGKRIWYATNDGKSQLHIYDVTTGQATAAGWPEGETDPVGYIAQNPVKQNEYAMATFARSVYLTADNGKTWRAIAKEGETIAQ